MRAGGIIGLKNLGEGKNTHYVLVVQYVYFEAKPRKVMVNEFDSSDQVVM